MPRAESLVSAKGALLIADATLSRCGMMDPRIKTIITLIENDPLERTRADEFCRLVNMSTSRFYQLFKAEVKACPACYVKAIRLETAKDLLKTTFLSVKEIAAKAGFNDLSHFVRDFKKNQLLTPTEYRKRHFKN